MKQLVDLFAEYVDLINEVPLGNLAGGNELPTRVRIVENEDEEENDEFMLVEVDSEEARTLALSVDQNNVQFCITYDAIAGAWLFTYYPSNDTGFEILGSSFEDVMYAAKVVLRNKIEFILEEPDSCLDYLDKEAEYFVFNRQDEVIS